MFPVHINVHSISHRQCCPQRTSVEKQKKYEQFNHLGQMANLTHFQIRGQLGGKKLLKEYQ